VELYWVNPIPLTRVHKVWSYTFSGIVTKLSVDFFQSRVEKLLARLWIKPTTLDLDFLSGDFDHSSSDSAASLRISLVGVSKFWSCSFRSPWMTPHFFHGKVKCCYFVCCLLECLSDMLHLFKDFCFYSSVYIYLLLVVLTLWHIGFYLDSEIRVKKLSRDLNS